MPAAPPPLRVLVIDDDPVMTELLSAILSLEGHTISTESTGEAALALFAHHTFDIALTDLQLPGLRGHALATKLRAALPAPARLLGMSGSAPSPQERAAFDAFLLKPFTIAQFTAAIQTSTAAASTPLPPTEPSAPTAPVLDQSIFAALSKQLPAAKLRELYQLTLDDARRRIALIATAEAAHDRDTVHREAHAIKGGAGMVGATELHRLAARAETGSPADTPPLADFLAACQRLERMLDESF
jgi:CheY-like chemotaxis protein/HPt (histidine-containing phosphotransfer) domain-containing protein